VIITSFLAFLILCLAFAQLAYNFYGAVSVARPCSCRWANNTRCAFLCPLRKLFYELVSCI